MRLTYVTSVYADYVGQFYRQAPDLALQPYAAQMEALSNDAFGWIGAWPDALAAHGYEVSQVVVNVRPLQLAWAWENDRGLTGAGPHSIALAQIEKSRPDVVWLDYHDRLFAQELRRRVPGVRLVMGWIGSALPEIDLWQDVDLVLSCAPESVVYLRERGIRSEHLNHAFNPALLGRLVQREPLHDLTFFGQIVRQSKFHFEREQLLLNLVEAGLCPVIYSPSAGFGRRDRLTFEAKQLIYRAVRLLLAVRIPESWLWRVPVLRRGLLWAEAPRMPVHPQLASMLRPGVFGLTMYQALVDSRITLNIHADSSPQFASNARLFETTGVGTCLLTDRRGNLHEMFEPDVEVVTYGSAQECAEKARWLLDHPAERRLIAKAGHARTLAEHTFEKRSAQLDAIIRRALASGR